MRQSIRALGWAGKILWIATAVFAVTSLYSPIKLLMEGQIRPGALQISFSNRTITMVQAFFVNNTGFYDLSDFNVTTSVVDYSGTLLSTSTTFVENIPRGGSVDETHEMWVSLDEIISKNLAYLLFNDSTIVLDRSVGLKIARLIPLRVSTSMNMSWGAPLYNLSIGEIGFPEPHNLTHQSITTSLSFENHSPFDVNGTMRLEIFNAIGEFVGLWVGRTSVSSGEEYNEEVTIYVNALKFSVTGEVYVCFSSPMGSLDWWYTYGR